MSKSRAAAKIIIFHCYCYKLKLLKYFCLSLLWYLCDMTYKQRQQKLDNYTYQSVLYRLWEDYSIFINPFIRLALDNETSLNIWLRTKNLSGLRPLNMLYSTILSLWWHWLLCCPIVLRLTLFPKDNIILCNLFRGKSEYLKCHFFLKGFNSHCVWKIFVCPFLFLLKLI